MGSVVVVVDGCLLLGEKVLLVVGVMKGSRADIVNAEHGGIVRFVEKGGRHLHARRWLLLFSVGV